MTESIFRPLVEVAVDSLASAVVAEAVGADRLELCQGLEVGGLTPSQGLIAAVRARIHLPLFVMIRPRAGGFGYDADDLDIMARDIGVASDAGADGIVVGVLNADGSVDLEAMRRLIRCAAGLPVTF